MDVTSSTGPRVLDGINIDRDADASLPVVIAEREISDPVTGLTGLGYEPGQKNRDGEEL